MGFKRNSLDGLAKTYEELGQTYERLSHTQAGPDAVLALYGMPVPRQVKERWPMLHLSKDYVEALCSLEPHILCEASVFCPAGDAVLASVVLEALKDTQKLRVFNMHAICKQLELLKTLQEQVLRLAGAASYIEEPLVNIDRRKKTVTTKDGKTLHYSKLVLAAAWRCICFLEALQAGIWTNQTLKLMELPLLPLVTSVEQQTYYATPEGILTQEK